MVSQRTTAATVSWRFWAQSMPVQYHAPAGSGQAQLGGESRLARQPCSRSPAEMCVPSVASNIRSTAAGSKARPSALGSWSSYSTAHMVGDSSPRFRVAWSAVSHPWGASVSDSTTGRRASPARPPGGAWP